MKEKEMRDKRLAKYTEFEIQAHLYCGLLSLGFKVRGEIKSSSLGLKPINGRNSRFDLVVLDKDYNPIEIIEVKKRNRKTEELEKTNQHKRYSRYGFPVRYVSGFGDMEDTLFDYKQKSGKAMVKCS